jgi:hypothetical protein
LTFARGILARIMEEERQREAVRKAAIDAALAKPPPPGVTKENWNHWHRRGWIVCAGNRYRSCSDPACGIGGKCKRLAELGLAGDGSPLRRKDRPRRGARTRKGTPCLVSGSSRANGAAASTAVSQPAPRPPRARRGSQRRSADGGLRGELVSTCEPSHFVFFAPPRQGVPLSLPLGHGTLGQ